MPGQPLATKILAAHLVSGSLVTGEEIAIRVDQTLTQDATGTLAMLEFEAMGPDRLATELSVSYVDHNMLQASFENADDHRFLQTFAAKHGLYFSRPGNGICHQVHLERFSAPGKTLLGADSHTPTCGGAGMLAIGAGGLDVAVAMAGGPFWLVMPRIVRVRFVGHLRTWVTAKDLILELLRRLTVKGGVGKIFEYTGAGVSELSVPERATITNMGAELGAVTSLFPSDRQTRRYLRAQGREAAWVELAADADAKYDETIEIHLDELEPLIALPHSPDNVAPVRESAGTPVQQVAIGSCTNSSYRDLLVAAKLLEGRVVHPDVSFVVTPGSRQAFLMAEVSGALENFIEAGARVLESACGPCIGMGQAPASGAVSLRSFNRNFEGRSGTADAKVYLASPETCVAAAITGVITDPRDLGTYPDLAAIPDRYLVDDRMIVPPAPDPALVTVLRGPNIAPLPHLPRLASEIQAEVILLVGDDITTDHILPAGAQILPLRSNLPKISEFVFARIDPRFAERARATGRSIVVAGRNYGQGSSREHAALAPRYLGVEAVIAVSFARIHAANLVNFGIVPLVFADPADRALLKQGDRLRIVDVAGALGRGDTELEVENLSSGLRVRVRAELTPRQREILRVGGLLNATAVDRSRAVSGSAPS